MHKPTIVDAFDSQRLAQVVSSEICSFHFGRVPQNARMSAFQLENLNLVLYEGHGLQWSDRRADQIRVDNADYFVLSMPLSARQDISQDGLNTELRPGSFVFVSTSRPSQVIVRSLSDNDGFRSLHIRIPGPLLRQRLPNIDTLCNHEIHLQRGAGSIMRNLVESTLEEAAYLSGDQALSLGVWMFEAICSVAVPAAELISGKASRRVAAPTRTYLRAKAYIEAHLSDPDLDIERIADHCQISARYLHSVFASSPESVAAFIRERRLQGCRQALLSPALKARQIIEIAGDWGFDDPSHFCHLYKTRFGKTPRQERASH